MLLCCREGGGGGSAIKLSLDKLGSTKILSLFCFVIEPGVWVSRERIGSYGSILGILKQSHVSPVIVITVLIHVRLSE